MDYVDYLVDLKRRTESLVANVDNFAGASHKRMYLSQVTNALQEEISNVVTAIAKEHGVEVGNEAVQVNLLKDFQLIEIYVPYGLVMQGIDPKQYVPFSSILQEKFGTTLFYSTDGSRKEKITIDNGGK